MNWDGFFHYFRDVIICANLPTCRESFTNSHAPTYQSLASYGGVENTWEYHVSMCGLCIVRSISLAFFFDMLSL